MAKQASNLKLSENSLEVLKSRYLLKNLAGEVVETPVGMFSRVAQAVAEVESRRVSYWQEKFYELMVKKRFLPNSPTLMNAGKKGGQLSACFVLPISDSLESIFDALKSAAKIHQSGGGTGFSFSRLRAKGTRVRSSQGVASGPVSFIRIFDVATDTIKQGGVRRGANMAVLRVDHPDIREFIEAKLNPQAMRNFNLSVGITDEFMTALKSGSSFALKDPRDGRRIQSVSAPELWDRITDAAWQCGDPGLVFLDRMNLLNPTPQEGEMESTNPCGEQPLLPFESCNLGSLNLSAYAQKTGFNWRAFRDDIEVAVRFLDNVMDANAYPLEEIKRITTRNRKIGLGVMGFADLLLHLGISFASEEAIEWGERLMSFLDRQAKLTSQALAREKGAFPNWKGSLWNRLGYAPMRNATVSTVAPTGTISLILGTSSGIEPIFSGLFYRNVLDGKRLVELHPLVEKKFSQASQASKKRQWDLNHLTEQRIAELMGPAWAPAWRVPVSSHVKIQAAFQRHSDSAVSKTINLPQSATRSEVSMAFQLAYQWGCKGITVYRDQSRASQVLEVQDSKGHTMSKLEEICSSC
ncbi:MAG: adenosylcobalamin-dependent ribonucleoside-diphosphate reductase [Bdellovibrionia bacterium]